MNIYQKSTSIHFATALFSSSFLLTLLNLSAEQISFLGLYGKEDPLKFTFYTLCFSISYSLATGAFLFSISDRISSKKSENAIKLSKLGFSQGSNSIIYYLNGFCIGQIFVASSGVIGSMSIIAFCIFIVGALLSFFSYSLIKKSIRENLDSFKDDKEQ